MLPACNSEAMQLHLDEIATNCLTDKRWKSFYDTMTDAGVFPRGLDLSKAYSLEFVNKGIGA